MMKTACDPVTRPPPAALSSPDAPAEATLSAYYSEVDFLAGGSATLTLSLSGCHVSLRGGGYAHQHCCHKPGLPGWL